MREESRGLGLGATLLGAAAYLAREAGADRMEWQTPPWNERAIAFYRWTGAEEAAKMRFTLATLSPRNG